MADVRAGKINIVLVYKVDRLTCSLADFAKLIELFDAHGVSFVSVTQSFNTSSSMGRLTLNVLLSFAQFERELIGERVRDKIAASKRKGIWVGGPVPLGYAAVDKKILVVPAEAEAVRTIFARYLELGSMRALAQDLDRRGIRSKPRRLSTGRTIGGGRFGVGALAHLLKNRFYIGEVVYHGDIHRGEHEPILDSGLFQAVQAKLAAQAVERRCRLRGSPAILSGRLFDDRGNRMSPTSSNKRGARYRYYVSQAVLQKQPRARGSVGRVPAAEIEALVIAALRNHLDASGSGGQLPDTDRDLLERHIERVTLTPHHIELLAAPDRGGSGRNRFPRQGKPAFDREHHDHCCSLDWPSASHCQGHSSRARSQHADQTWPPGGAPDRDRQGPPMDRRFGARPAGRFRRNRPSGRKGRAAHPSVGNARLCLTPNRVGTARQCAG